MVTESGFGPKEVKVTGNGLEPKEVKIAESGFGRKEVKGGQFCIERDRDGGRRSYRTLKAKACSAVWEPFVRAIRGSAIDNTDFADTIRSHRTLSTLPKMAQGRNR
jgi:hypothetical protein